MKKGIGSNAVYFIALFVILLILIAITYVIGLDSLKEILKRMISFG